MNARALFLAVGLFTALGCSSSDGGGTNPSPDAGPDGGDADIPDPAIALPCKDSEESIYAAWDSLPAEKGAVLRCAKGAPIAKADLQAKADANGYKGKPLTSGAKVYRILYRTERGSKPVLPGASSAIVYLPDTPRAQKSPLVVFGHGSRGQAGKCAPSRFSPEGEYVRSDFESAVFPLVGAGYAVIAPDWAGYANFGAKDNPPSGYAASEDVGKSMLDATRAFRKLAPSVLSDKVVIVGHSQGGHTALSTLALSESYGVDGTIAGSVVYAPLWMPQRTWAALLLLADSYPIATSPTPNAVSIWYHYTHGELLDGPGKGLEVFAESKRAGIKKFVEESCWAKNYPILESLGTTLKDIMDPTFADAITAPAAGGSDCPTEEPKKSLCEKWLARYKDDRPVLAGKAATVPILFLYGNKDTTIPPDRITCSRDFLKKTGGTVSYCIEPEADHGGIVKVRASYANDWIASVALGEPAPAACDKKEGDIVDPATGKPAECNPLPPND